MALRFDADQAMLVGASKPGVRRLYELTVGLVSATMPSACSKSPPIKLSAVFDSWYSAFSSKKAFLPSLKSDRCVCIPEPLIPATGLGIKVAWRL